MEDDSENYASGQMEDDDYDGLDLEALERTALQSQESTPDMPRKKDSGPVTAVPAASAPALLSPEQTRAAPAVQGQASAGSVPFIGGGISVSSNSSGSLQKRPQQSTFTDTSKRPKPGAVSGVMSGFGTSQKRNSARGHAKNMLDKMVTTTSHADNPPDVFDNLSGDQLCTRILFERFAGWLTDEDAGYKFRDGFEKDGTTPKYSHLMASTCVNYIQDLMHSVKLKFGLIGTPEQKLFLHCVVKDSGEDSTWWFRLRKNVMAKLCQMHAEAGDVEDKAALPIYPGPHVSAMIRSLLRHGTEESIRRALEILTASLSCGRSTESSLILRDSIIIDHYHKCIFMDVFMTKNASYKMVPFVASPDRHLDWYLMWILFIAMVGYGVHDEDEALWLLPSLHRTVKPAQQIGNYIKDLRPVERGGSREYKDFSVDILPENPSAAGLRKGVLYTLNGKAPDKHMCTISGHSVDDPERVSILESYRPEEPSIAKAVASLVVGWEEGEYGKPRNNRLPWPPDLSSLGFDGELADTMKQIMEDTLNLNSASDPRFMNGGSLRWVVETGWASLLMNYDNMWAGGEAKSVLVKMQDCTRTMLGDSDVHNTLVSWGDLIRTKFKTDNLPITCRLQLYPDLKLLVDMVSDLSSKYVSQQQSMLTQNARQTAREIIQNTRQNLILDQLRKIGEDCKRILDFQGDPAPVWREKGKSSVDPEIDDADKQRQGNAPHEAGSSSIQSLSLPCARSVNDPGVLHGGGAALKSKVKDYSCIELYVEMVQGDGNVPTTLGTRQDKASARIVFLHYECMVKMDEKQLLNNRIERSTDHKGKVAILKEHLDHVVKASLIWAYVEEKVDVPRGLLKNLNATGADKKFTPNSLEAKRREGPVKIQFPDPEKNTDGTWTDLSTSKMREISQVFRTRFETYCVTAKNLGGKTAHYLTPHAKYPQALRLVKDINDNNFV